MKIAYFIYFMISSQIIFTSYQIVAIPSSVVKDAFNLNPGLSEERVFSLQANGAIYENALRRRLPELLTNTFLCALLSGCLATCCTASPQVGGAVAVISTCADSEGCCCLPPTSICNIWREYRSGKARKSLQNCIEKFSDLTEEQIGELLKLPKEQQMPKSFLKDLLYWKQCLCKKTDMV